MMVLIMVRIKVMKMKILMILMMIAMMITTTIITYNWITNHDHIGEVDIPLMGFGKMVQV